MNNIIKRTWNQGIMPNIEDLRGMAFQAESGAHTFVISAVDDNNNPITLSGTPSGTMLRPDNTDQALTCSVSDGKVYATLPAGCYDMPGRAGITIFLTSGGQKTAIYAAIVYVTRTQSGTASPGTTASVVDLVNAIAAAVATIPASYTDLMAAVAPTYSSSGLYAVGSYALYSGKLYRCTTAITTAETWTAAHWTLANLGSDLADLKSAFNGSLMYSYDVQESKTGIWSQGYIKSADGTNASDNVTIRTGYIRNDVLGIKPKDGYNALIYCYNSSGTYQGVLQKDGSVQKSSASFFRVREYFCIKEFAETNGYKIRLTLEKNNGATITPSDGTNMLLYFNRFEDGVDFDSDFISNKYYPTGSYSVGDTIPSSLSPSSENGYKCLKIRVYKGDTYKIAGVAGNEPRLWCITDIDRKVLSIAANGDSSVYPIDLTINQDGYIYVNFLTTNNTYTPYFEKYVTIETNGKNIVEDREKITEAQDSISLLLNENESYYDYSSYIVSGKDIITAVANGTYLSFATEDDASYSYAVIPVFAGDEFVLNGAGGNGPRFWNFTDRRQILLSKSGSGASGPVTVTASQDGYLVYNSVNNSSSYPIAIKKKATHENISNSLKNLVENTNENWYVNLSDKSKLMRKNITFGGFSLQRYYFGLGSDYSLFNANTTSDQYFTALSQLVASHTDYVTISTIINDEEDNPLYLYKFKPINTEDYGRPLVKMPKIIIICGQHGDEKGATFGLYYFLRDLLNNWKNDATLEYIRTNVELDIIPIVNRYGYDHNQNRDYNDVNINRNYDNNWYYSSAEKTGPNPFSEKGAVAVKTVVEDNLDAFLFIDWHTYGHVPPNEYGLTHWISLGASANKNTDNFDVLYSKLFSASSIHMRRFSECTKSTYNLNNTTLLGRVTIENEDGPTSAEWVNDQKNIMGLTVETFAGFKGDEAAYSSDSQKASSEAFVNFLGCVLAEYSPIYSRYAYFLNK